MDEFVMAAYVDHRLGPADRDRAEAHLAGCAECRHELLEVRGFLRQATRPRRLIVGASLLAAAAALVLMVRPSAPDPVRDGGAEATLAAYGPAGEVSLASLRFVWGTAPGAVTYRLTISGANGDSVWSGSVTDTSWTLPDANLLRADESYFWVADALLDDGSARSTGLRAFRPVK